MTGNYIVIKFGGTSVSSLASWRNIRDIIRRHQTDSQRVLVVCSAITQVSNKLDSLLSAALVGKHAPALQELEVIHRRLSDELGLDFVLLAPYFNRLNQLIEGVSLILEASPRIRAQVMAMGELMLTVLGTAYLQAEGLPVAWQDARQLLVTQQDPLLHSSATYLSAYCTAEPDNQLIDKLNSLSPVVITQGFIASNADGETVLLGRGGSDTSAAYFAAKINALSCEIWTDVPGIYTANPRQIPEARLLKQLDYDEAQEIASMGGKVLHPNCIPPVKQRQIPLWVKCTAYPERAGTLVALATEASAVQIKSILCKYGIILISIETMRMWQQVGFLADVFACFKRRGLSVNMVSTSESNLTVSLDTTATANDMELIKLLLADLSEFSKPRMIGPCAAVSLIGHNIRASLHKLGEVFEVFEQQQIHLLSQAANDLNLSFVVDEDQAERLAQKIHVLLIEKNPSVRYFNQSWLEEFGESVAATTLPWWQQRREDLLKLMDQQHEPLYVYDRQCVQRCAQQLLELSAVDSIYYAMKANSNADILRCLYQMGLGIECVSLAEVYYVLQLFPEIDRSRILFTPNFAPKEEYEQAFAEKIWVTLDSLYPLQHWPEIFAERNILIRLDPGQGYGHHHYVCTGGSDSKFGIPFSEIKSLLALLAQHQVMVKGLHAHVGSGILRPETWKENFMTLTQLLAQFPDVEIINLGGGLGINEKPSQNPLDLVAINESLIQVKEFFPNLQIWLEPGRYLVAEAGVLLARVTQVKDKGDVVFVGIETGMNSLIRPALYGSYHEIENLTRLHDKRTIIAHVVGPICESGDILGYSRVLPETQEGDVMLIANAGAYGRVMSSQYNMRAPAKELVI